MTSAKATAATASRLELHLRRGGGVGRGLEVRLGLEAREAGDEAVRKEREARVVVANGLVVAPPLDDDAILRALELGLQAEEVLVALQLGIALHGDQQPAERTAELLLGGLEPLHRLGVVERLGRELHAGGARPGL